MVSKETDKHLKLRASQDSGLGKCIAYLQEHPLKQQTLASQTLEARFLPFVMDKNDPQFEAIAIQCAEQCLSWARAIQQYASLKEEEGVIGTNGAKLRGGLSQNPQLESPEITTEVEDDDHLMLSEEEKRQSQGEDLMNSMGLL